MAQAKSNFPTPLIVGIVIVAVVIGVLYLQRNQVMAALGRTPLGKFIPALQQQTGGTGNPMVNPWGLPGVLGDNVVKTKADGIATCQKSGIDECFALVAVSFKDLSVCQKARDRKKCETNANNMIKELEARPEPEGSAEPEATARPDDNQELKTCAKGTFYQTTEGKVAVTGREVLTLGGKKYDVCCYEATDFKTVEAGEPTALKNCSFIDQPDDGLASFEKIDGQYQLRFATLKVGEKNCTYVFEEGQQTAEMCQ
jgi:hypothetical protein